MNAQLLRITFFLAISFTSSGISKAQCISGFTDSIDSLTVYFTSTASGAYDVIQYNFGDGNFSNQVEDPVHTFSEEGYYEVCQTIYDSATFTCFATNCDTLIVGDPTCFAAFDWFDDGLEVQFSDVSLGSYDSLSWDFGDGASSSNGSPAHTYDSAGSYLVCLSLFDSLGSLCDSTCRQMFIDTLTCEPDFTFITDGLTVDFTNTSEGDYNLVTWDFGDSVGFSIQEDPSYTYLTAGTYTVCLYIVDTATFSCNAQICKEVTVTSGGGGGCEADFSYSTIELEIECQNTSSGSFLTAIWDYGDGSTPSTQASHVYEEPGTYDVCLTIGNLIPFCLDQTCKEVTVIETTCQPSFEYSYNIASNLFYFVNTTTVGEYDNVLWEFGDGNTSTFTNPNYTYNVPGEYEVCLSTFDGEYFCGISCRMISVYPVGQEEIGASGLHVFPNPSFGAFVLERNGQGGLVQITLSDLLGREVARDVSNEQRIALSYDVPAGVYLMHVRTEFGKSEVLRIVVE